MRNSNLYKIIDFGIGTKLIFLKVVLHKDSRLP